MRHDLAFLVLALGACGGSGDPTHWKDQPLETVQGTIEGHAYAIELPKGMVKSADSYADSYEYKAKRGDELYVFAPRVSISWQAKKQTIEEARKYEKATPTKQEQKDDGFVVVSPNDSKKGAKGDDVIIHVQRYAGDGAFECRARLYPMVKGEDVQALIPRVEKMCLSVTAK